MGRVRAPSPCCHVVSTIRYVSLEEGEMVFRCSACGSLRIEPVDRQKPERAKRPTRLRLIK